MINRPNLTVSKSQNTLPISQINYTFYFDSKILFCHNVQVINTKESKAKVINKSNNIPIQIRHLKQK